MIFKEEETIEEERVHLWVNYIITLYRRPLCTLWQKHTYLIKLIEVNITKSKKNNVKI